MTTFQIGDRVRLKAGTHRPGYQAGDTGTICAVMPPSAIGGQELYQVRMDKNQTALPPSFYGNELEPLE